MKIVMYYATEVRELEFDPAIISFLFEDGDHSQRLFRKEYIDIKNPFVSTKGVILNALRPVSDYIGTLNKIEIYEGDTLVNTITGLKNPVYKFGTPNPKEINTDLQVPQLQEIFQIDL